MGQIIKQPNGKFCIFSSICDNVTSYNCTEEEIVNELVEDARKDIERKVKGIIEKLNEGGEPYYQFTMSYEKMLQTIEEVHGKIKRNVTKTIIET
jgi:hypothetical protein